MSDVRTAKLKFSELKFLDDNPRTITREDLERLAGRIKEDPTFFDNRSCLVNFTDGQYLCYAGFQRAHAAAKILKWKEIPCSIENDVPVSVMRKRAILDNTHDGKWDADVLSSWEYTREEFVEAGVPEYVFERDNGEDESEPLPFTPSLSPEYAKNQVTDTDIEKTAVRLKDKFLDGDDDKVEFICPHCTETFFVNKRDI